jgi:hypothetical protein
MGGGYRPGPRVVASFAALGAVRLQRTVGSAAPQVRPLHSQRAASISRWYLVPMGLTDREAATMRASDAVSKAHQTMRRHTLANGGNPAMAFRNGLREAVLELKDSLIKVYARLDEVSDDQARDELAAEISRLGTSFIASSARGERGSHIGAVARYAATASNTFAIALIKRSLELAVHDKESPMLSRLANNDITLIKPDGSRHSAKASVQPGKIFVFDLKFPVAVGDQILHSLPSGIEQRFEVLDPGFIGVPNSRLSHYEIKVRNAASPRSTLTSSVVHTQYNHHYHNSGIANVIGPDGVASGNTNTIQLTHQTLTLHDPRIADELATIRKALLSESEDDDATLEAGNVVLAQRSLKAGDENGFRAAMKKLGSKTWDVAEKLALAWMTGEGRHLLGLSPG